MNPEDVQALARQIMAEGDRRFGRTTGRTAIVMSYEFDPATSVPLAQVHFPEDPPGDNREVNVLVGQPLEVGTPVLVTAIPPFGAAIIGTLARFTNEIVFSQNGTLSEQTSPPWPARRTRLLRRAVVELGTAGTTATVFDLLVDGASVETLTMAAGLDSDVFDLDVVLTEDERLQVETTTAGTGAADATVVVEYT